MHEGSQPLNFLVNLQLYLHVKKKVQLNDWLNLHLKIKVHLKVHMKIKVQMNLQMNLFLQMKVQKRLQVRVHEGWAPSSNIEWVRGLILVNTDDFVTRERGCL